MNKTLSTTLIIIAALVLAGSIFFAGNMYARANAFGPSMMFGNSSTDNSAYGPDGMMGGQGGMMNMMGGNGNNNTNVTPLSVDQAKDAAEKYLANLDNSDLQIAEIMIFDNNAYVVVKEASTGSGAFELLVDPTSQIAYPEHGPNMMWNLKYGAINHEDMMGSSNGMMGGSGGMMNMMGGSGWDTTIPANISAELTVTPDQAIEYAQTYLDANISGAAAAMDPINFYGYYTLDFEKDGKVAGMLSVNGYSGQVFLHTWHGIFIEESEIQ